MTHQNPLADLDRAGNSLKYGVAMLGAIQFAIAEGGFEATDSIYGVWLYFDFISKEISSCIEDCFAQRRAKGGTQ